ncbi:MAG TPA: hypothetical protein VFW24_05950 [Acidimicrobiales bacterium]|nr:hypothetical protein [Acidimicrobiales bacterium]
MARPTSFRLPEDLLERLDSEASASGTSATALVAGLLDEGLKTRKFPGIVYRSGPTGRRAGLANGPDLWEVVRAVRRTRGKGEPRLRQVAEDSGLTIDQVRLAVEFYTAFPDEVDARIAADDEAARQVREAIERRERLLSS